MSRAEPVLRMTDVDKRFPGVQALAHASLEVRPGEVHALLGENGAGKSTLMKVLCGQVQPDDGTVTLDDVAVRPTSPIEAERIGLVMIHQELSLVPGLTVGDNIALGHEPTSAGVIRSRVARRAARDLLDRVRCRVDPDTMAGSLSVAEQQLVEIARAIGRNARVMVMDEPTAALADHEIEALFEVISDLCRSGVPVIYISHRMPEIFTIADRVTVMRDGRTVGTRDVASTEPAELIRLMVGRTIAEQIPKRDVALGDELLSVDGIEWAGARAPTTLSVRAGEILGVAGLMGSGRTALARAVFGADPITAGTVRIAGDRLPPNDPAAAIAAGIGFLTEDRKDQGLVLQLPVAANITLTSLDDLSRFGVLDLDSERKTAGAMVERLAIRVASPDQAVADLSGGNQQKVVLARWLAARCRVLLFDEPTRGIDVGAKAEIYELIGELVDRGVAVLLISSELPELLSLADRIAVMHDGALEGVLARDEATPERIMELALG